MLPQNFNRRMNVAMEHNVKVLCAVGDFGDGTFNLLQKTDSSIYVQLTTSAPIAQNTCYKLAGFSAQKLNRSTNKKSF